MSRNFLLQKILIITTYLAVCAGTTWWVFFSVPEVKVPKIQGEVLALPGGVDILLVTNKDTTAWHDVHVVVNQDYGYFAAELPPQKQLTVTRGGMTYLYFVPHPWEHGPFAPVARKQPTLRLPSSLTISPNSVHIQAREGILDTHITP